jgi:hypothetical protein
MNVFIILSTMFIIVMLILHHEITVAQHKKLVKIAHATTYEILEELRTLNKFIINIYDGIKNKS